MPIQRSAIILMNEADEVALIRRDKPGQTYYVFPGGGREAGATLEETAIREAHEELGVDVQLEGIAAIVRFNGLDNPYYWARMIGGVFGTGTGEEFEDQSSGYTPLWIKREELADLPVRPATLVQELTKMTERFYEIELEDN
ncbi:MULTISPECIES: NUDIX domain-containing protein [Exiguobacterium]|uniref:NUDIX domain-containing protein n=2 Tax=Exiguobacterium antarcticum TaxID=132920 RepID=A0ABT6R2S4_9BACL|nr:MULTISPECIES: NUDIX domain-containing protein [Exiguobacterium]MCT4780646.1 NUDIX domain-containing protein [Exiguobacterium soli]MDI3235249.1 NUDIX domain-containing protein [Exiguobacterium antarcticum]